MQSTIRPNTYIALKLPSDTIKVLQIIPNTTISLGKYGSIQANHILGRPYHVTFELLDEPEPDGYALRIVPTAELHAEQLIADAEVAEGEETPQEADDKNGAEARDNRETLDDPSSQQMTLNEIEALKKGSGSGKDIITQLLRSHSALEKKTDFSLAKYTLRKRRKYSRRFTILPLDVPVLTEWMLELRDPTRILELRDEMIGLIGCWANVHHGGGEVYTSNISSTSPPSGRWLVVDDTGGFVVGAMAERMGILHPTDEPGPATGELGPTDTLPEGYTNESRAENNQSQSDRRPQPMSATNTTLTVIHNNVQPNLSILRYFNYDASDPPENHPLYTHLKTMSWLQLLQPSSDPIYKEQPPIIPDSVLATWKPNKRGLYYRKRRRWAKVSNVVDETRAGGFDGLIVASLMDPVSVLKHCVPLLKGSAPVVVYSAHIERLVKLADLYSSERRTAYISTFRGRSDAGQPPPPPNTEPGTPANGIEDSNVSREKPSVEINEEDFPVDPTLLLAPTIQTSRVRPWQVLPGRTHPMMSGRGGAEGYVFHAIRALPSKEKVEARGKPMKKRRKLAPVDTPDDTSKASDAPEAMGVDDTKS